MPVFFVLFFVLFFGLFFATACRNDTPVAPTVESTRLDITPPLSAVKLQQSKILTAVVSQPGAAARTVDAEWSSTNAQVLGIDAKGAATARALGNAQVEARWNGLSAGLSIRVIPDFAGRWSGEFTIVECRRVSGNGPDICRFFLNASFPVILDVQHEDTQVTGVLQLFPDPVRGPVSGIVDDSNDLVIRGTITRVEEHFSQVELTEWSTALDSATSQLHGTFLANYRFDNAWGRQQTTIGCRVGGLLRE